MTNVIMSWPISLSKRHIAAYSTDWTYQAALTTLWLEFVQDARLTFIGMKL